MQIKKLFLENLNKMDLPDLKNEFIDNIITYFLELKEWNKKFNLTGLKSDEDIIIKLFIDSLYFIKLNIVSHCETILDIGSGAGFPGIPNALYFKNKRFFLIEANRKKCSFLKHIKNKLFINNIKIINERAEKLSKMNNYADKFDCALIKALAKFDISMKLALPLIKNSGYCVYYASNKQKSEILSDNKLCDLLGFKIDNIFDYDLNNSGKRCLIIVKKLWKTGNNKNCST
jgi:16S rRNA (guanine527-N7)-methyltransferase